MIKTKMAGALWQVWFGRCAANPNQAAASAGGRHQSLAGTSNNSRRQPVAGASHWPATATAADVSQWQAAVIGRQQQKTQTSAGGRKQPAAAGSSQETQCISSGCWLSGNLDRRANTMANLWLDAELEHVIDTDEKGA